MERNISATNKRNVANESLHVDFVHTKSFERESGTNASKAAYVNENKTGRKRARVTIVLFLFNFLDFRVLVLHPLRGGVNRLKLSYER